MIFINYSREVRVNLNLLVNGLKLGEHHGQLALVLKEILTVLLKTPIPYPISLMWEGQDEISERKVAYFGFEQKFVAHIVLQSVIVCVELLYLKVLHVPDQ